MLRRNRPRVTCALAGLFCLAGAATLRPGQFTMHKAPPKPAYGSETDEADECVDCHQSEVKGFARSKMAQSMRLPGQEPNGVVNVPGTVIRMTADLHPTTSNHNYCQKQPAAAR